MSKNVGRSDRDIRLVIAIIIGALVLFKVVKGLLAIIFVVIIFYLIITAYKRICLLYSMLGISTRKRMFWY
jgi:hypothetical protein